MKTFAAGDYETIAVLPFDTSKIEPGEGDKGVTIQGALDGYTAVFVEGLRDGTRAMGEDTAHVITRF